MVTWETAKANARPGPAFPVRTGPTQAGLPTLKQRIRDLNPRTACLDTRTLTGGAVATRLGPEALAATPPPHRLLLSLVPLRRSLQHRVTDSATVNEKAEPGTLHVPDRRQQPSLVVRQAAESAICKGKTLLHLMALRQPGRPHVTYRQQLSRHLQRDSPRI